MKKIFFWTVAAAATFAVLLIVPGLLMAPNHVSVRTIALNSKPEVVWDALTNFEELPTWRSGVKRVEVKKTGDQTLIIEHGDEQAMTFRLLAFDPPHRFQTEIADDDLPFAGTWTWELKPQGRGCALTITEHGNIKSAPMRTVAAVLMDPAQTQDQYLRELAAHLDEDAEPGPG